MTTLRASKDRENLKKEEDKKRFLKLQQETKEPTQLLNFFERKEWKSEWDQLNFPKINLKTFKALKIKKASNYQSKRVLSF